VYRLVYKVETDESEEVLKRDVKSAIRSVTGEVNSSPAELFIVLRNVFVNPAGFAGIEDNLSEFDVEVRFFPDIQARLDQFAVSDTTTEIITEEIKPIPHVSSVSGWELDFMKS